jgi:hypothetical protein
MGKESMRNKIIGIFVCMLLITTILPTTAIAGNETHPEISDKTGDARFDIDIQKAWFFENSTNPDYLYITIQVEGFHINYYGADLYDVYWTMNNVNYFVFAGLGIYMNGAGGRVSTTAGIVRIDNSWNYNITVSLGQLGINRTITCKIPKSIIGSPHTGDILTKTNAFTSKRTPLMAKIGWDALFRDWLFSHLRLNSLNLMDFAPDSGYGSDYIIQY